MTPIEKGGLLGGFVLLIALLVGLGMSIGAMILVWRLALYGICG